MLMRIQFNCFPGGITKAVTLSYDDGKAYDRILVELFNTYGLRGTFHLNSSILNTDTFITSKEVQELFAGHEVSAHTRTHPFLDQSPKEQIIKEVLDDCLALEKLVQYPVKGMSYPFGAYNEKVIETLRAIGIEYARTVNSHGGFHMPQDWLAWHPTCHHKDMLEYGEKLLNNKVKHTRMELLYVWGHSYEFENDNNWELVERFGELIGGNEQIWYATNIEIYTYMQALNQLRFSTDYSLVHNPTATDVWVTANGESVHIPAGKTILF